MSEAEKGEMVYPVRLVLGLTDEIQGLSVAEATNVGVIDFALGTAVILQDKLPHSLAETILQYDVIKPMGVVLASFGVGCLVHAARSVIRRENRSRENALQQT